MAFLPKVTQEQFEAMTQDQRWVAVAEDVLAQLDAKRVGAEAGMWLTSRGEPVRYSREGLADANAPPCCGCAVGLAFLSVVRLGNRYDEQSSTGLGLQDFRPFLNRTLGAREWQMMEYAFEQGEGAVSGARIPLYIRRELRSRFFPIEGEESRLRAIMQAIIENGGTLLPRTADVS